MLVVWCRHAGIPRQGPLISADINTAMETESALQMTCSVSFRKRSVPYLLLSLPQRWGTGGAVPHIQSNGDSSPPASRQVRSPEKPVCDYPNYLHLSTSDQKGHPFV
ncbi:hypothetical protein AAFF_G00415400 [Aldrovandia affinis]|uniref:Uncharacterized protein n=1 Tax=Aldrovandia affinis TaxID=143900 RepID=A0AAD7WJC0_9TELE|nr:hypothetical protein AAFF_G00415400 [Aldrovandia affinis]